MTRWQYVLKQTLGTLLIVFVGFWSTSCTDDLYASCQLDVDDPFVRQCVESESGRETSCVIEQHLQCETRICAKYQSSDPFCSIACSTDGDCPGGMCREFVFQSGAKYCVESIHVKD